MSIIFILSFSCKSNKKPYCSQFKSGKFLYKWKVGDQTLFFSINRNDSTQTEINQDNGDTTKLSIKWTGPCSYDLRFLESDVALPDSLKETRKKTIISTEITENTSRYYIFRTKANNSSLLLFDTMWVKD